MHLSLLLQFSLQQSQLVMPACGQNKPISLLGKYSSRCCAEAC
jgi:hypothetical protein